MIIKLTNGRQFIIKNEYKTIDKLTSKKDEYGRDIFTVWEERECTVRITEFFKSEPYQRVSVCGRSHCSYQDKFDKTIARVLAYCRAVNELERIGEISSSEALEFSQFELNQSVFEAEPIDEEDFVADEECCHHCEHCCCNKTNINE